MPKAGLIKPRLRFVTWRASKQTLLQARAPFGFLYHFPFAARGRSAKRLTGRITWSRLTLFDADRLLLHWACNLPLFL